MATTTSQSNDLWYSDKHSSNWKRTHKGAMFTERKDIIDKGLLAKLVMGKPIEHDGLFFTLKPNDVIWRNTPEERERFRREHGWNATAGTRPAVATTTVVQQQKWDDLPSSRIIITIPNDDTSADDHVVVRHNKESGWIVEMVVMLSDGRGVIMKRKNG